MSLILLLACTGTSENDTTVRKETADSADTADSGDADLSEVSGSYKDRCGIDLESQAGQDGADVTGTLVVVQDGVTIGPWAGFGVTLDFGGLYSTFLYACVPAEDGAGGGELGVNLTSALYPETDVTALNIQSTVSAEGNALGNLTDAAGLTDAGPGFYLFTSGTASVDPTVRDGGRLIGTFAVGTHIAVDVTVDVSW